MLQACLNHETLDDAVEAASAVVQRLAGELGNPLLAGAQRSEVLSRPRRGIREELEHNSPDCENNSSRQQKKNTRTRLSFSSD